jgi:predicted acylesterase/phospholipase RssA
MAKLKIEELKYIVMEGGGARGTAYLGAVKALENQLKDLVKNNPIDYKITSVHPDRIGGPGIMDFLKMDYENHEYKPIIQGVSGGSAGAITTFCILLGLNSTEIEKVLNTDFKNFLNEIDPGKYRMIDHDSKLKVAIDKDDVLGKAGEVFEYKLKENKTNINKNTLLSLKRKFVFNMVIKVIGDGLISNFDQLINFFSNQKDAFSKNIQKIITDNMEIGSTAVKYATSQGLYWFFSNFLLSKLSKKLGMKIKSESAITLFADNGTFSGFQVREFFYDLLIYAATRDTFFQKQMLKYYSNNICKGKDIFTLFKENTDCFKDFKILERSKTFKDNIDFGDETYKIFNQLQDITFQELWEITGIEFATGVSNFTAGKPLYFSDIYTPHFRVLEAVAASMNIPPIKPILNASNVIIGSRVKDEGYKVPDKFGGIVNDIEKVDFKGDKVNLSANIDAYNFYEHRVKKYLQEELRLDKDAGNPYVDVNNNIDLHTFLPKLMQLVIGRKYDKDTGKLSNDRILDEKKAIADEYKDVNYDILKFYYNAQYKGLLIDGGYYNNVPYNYFRDSVLNFKKNFKDRLDGVLAIKLDNNYPTRFIKEFNDKYEPNLKKIINLEQEIDDDIYGTGEPNRYTNAEYLKLIELVRLDIYQKFLNDSDVNQKALDKEAILRLISAMLKAFKNNNTTIWLKKKSILAIALEGYSFGAERGQVRTISDHDHILPLYSYGVGTFDFDLKKVNPMAKLAQAEAEKDVNEYFMDNNQQKD